MFKKESEFQRFVCDMFRFRPFHYVLNTHGHSMQKPGLPDLYVSGPRFRGWVELKMRGRWLSPVQEDHIKSLVFAYDHVIILQEDCESLKVCPFFICDGMLLYREFCKKVATKSDLRSEIEKALETWMPRNKDA